MTLDPPLKMVGDLAKGVVGGSRNRRDRGSMTVLLLMISAALMTVVVTAVGSVGSRLIARQQAQNAADSAALAAVIAGPDRAHEVAAMNHSVIVEMQYSEQVATVVVVIKNQRATARASKAPGSVPTL